MVAKGSLYSSSGKDALNSGSGNDKLYSDSGSDTLDGGSGYNEIYERLRATTLWWPRRRRGGF